MKNKWGRRIGVFALAAISSALMFSSKGITAKAADDVEWVYNYTGNIQSWTAPYDGKYKLEVWGAKGGNAGYLPGGKGGYSKGEITLKAGDKLYICVGQAGQNFDGRTHRTSYNGGGAGGENNGGGGGATSIALNNNYGELYKYSEHRGDIIIVAGGGGGSDFEDWSLGRDGYGGYGGGLTGGDGRSADHREGTGGTQSAGGFCYEDRDADNRKGKFGYGGGYVSTIGGAGGGGGWYGGGAGGWNNGTSGGGGGSGYINTSKLSNASTTGNKADGPGVAKITSLHTHVYTSQVTTNPTCTVPGVKTYTCIGTTWDPGCGHQYTESIPALNHDCSVVVPLGTKGYEVPGRPGYFYTRKCSRCGSHYCREELGQFLQQTFVKYMDTNGNYPNDWKLADSKLVIYDQYYSWEYADRQEFKGNSVYYKVTKANNNYVYIERKKYQQQVIVYYQNADGLGDADATFTPITEVSGDYFYGSQVTWKYTPRVEYNDTVTSSRRDGTVQTSLTYNVTDHKVTEFWAFRKLVTLDINGEYLWKASVDASDESGTKYKYPNLGYSATDSNNNMGTFDIYINGKLDTQKGHNVRDYYRTDILYGSKWEVENIESDAGKHYYGSEVN